MQITTETKVPIYSWANDLEDSAREQALIVANEMPIHKHFALMPDAHMGMGVPIGGVMALTDAICPNAVGVDIGCGMLALRTDLQDIGLDAHKRIRERLRRAIPMGFNKHNIAHKHKVFDDAPDIAIIQHELANARLQLGTLGGGNHFIEVQKGDDGFIWIMVHSGSRNIGKKICDHYNALAKNVGNSDVKDLAYFSMHQPEAHEYSTAMSWALDFAKANREEMARQIKLAFEAEISWVHFTKEINIHHNYAALEKHFCKYVVVHRKGATFAGHGHAGIIPGSQGTPSYIVRGLGNPNSFESCSHGAGRRMSRTKATGLTRRGKRKFDAGISVEDATEAMGGLLCRYDESNVDEAPQAYKDIKAVMAAQSDLVEVITELTPYQISALKG